MSADERRIAAIGHDVSLSRDPALVKAATSYALAALENERLVGRAPGVARRARPLARRLVAVADRERRRIERDLHDGAQQRLVALRARLELVAERLDADSPASADAIRELGDEVEETIDEVRSFARGIYPSLLAERGLDEALRAAARSAPLPTMVARDGIGRYRARGRGDRLLRVHGGSAERRQARPRADGVVITVSQNPHLRFEVRDDGAGFDPATVAGGNGLTNLQDRLAAVGGALLVESAPGAGCAVSGVIPAS